MKRFAVALCLLLVSCGTTPAPPAAPPSSAVPTTTTSAVPLDPSIMFSIAQSTYPADLGRCTPTTPPTDAECGTAIDNAGKVAAKMKENFPDRAPIVKASDDLVKMVATARKLGCYGLGKPAGDESMLAQLCPTFVQTVLLSWLALNAAAR